MPTNRGKRKYVLALRTLKEVFASLAHGMGLYVVSFVLFNGVTVGYVFQFLFDKELFAYYLWLWASTGERSDLESSSWGSFAALSVLFLCSLD